MEDTNYYLNVASLNHEEEENDNDEEEINGKVSYALSGAMDRFSRFFIDPSFNPDSVERELRAIDSEHMNSMTSDSWRNYLLLKNSCDPKHPFSKCEYGFIFILSLFVIDES